MMHLKVLIEYLDLTIHVYDIRVFGCDGIYNCICSCFFAYNNNLLMIAVQLLLKIIVHVTHSTCNIIVNGQMECSISVKERYIQKQCSF